MNKIRKMESSAVRERFLSYFEGKGHARVPSSSLVPADDPTLMFTNSGMVQFKDVFLGFDRRDYDKAATSQRCLRAGGKHNDLDNVGYTARHHTFFEMLGNFSFGDYFKERAIPLAWELLTRPQDEGGYGLGPEHLWITVFGGGELFGKGGGSVPADDDASEIWTETLRGAGFSAKEAKARITAVPTTDNFWMMGDTGPCGPCSEVFYNRNAKAERFEGDDERSADLCPEIWNLVFMQFNRSDTGELAELPSPCVDTGMGLERLSAVLQGKESNYDTDLFAALLDAAAAAVDDAGGKADRGGASLRVIADHIRAAAYLVADRVLPSNEGRGYVLRRIIRRALRHGHQLGAKRPFFAGLAEPLAGIMGDAHPELPARLGSVTEALAAEEERFARTLHDGMRILEKHVAGGKKGAIDGATVFMLYDTYGFPTDLTEAYARDHNLAVDMEGFERELKVQQDRSRAASGFAAGQDAVDYGGPATDFERDAAKKVKGEVAALFKESGEPADSLGEGEAGIAVISATSFYAESGGQVGDRGTLAWDGGEARVADTFKLRGDVHGHRVEVTEGELRAGGTVECRVDGPLRAAVCRAHSATHLLHEALRRRLGDHVEQRGSLVEGDRLRFDFSHDRQLSDADLDEVERTVCAQALANAPVVIREMPHDEAIASGAKALFGERYGKVVRVVEIDPEFSVELCGGTHVSSAAEVGPVRLEPDEAVAAGVRRIEARTGLLAQSASRQDARVAGELAVMLKSPRDGLVGSVTSLRSSLRDERRRVEAMESAAVGAQVRALADGADEVGGARVLVAKVDSGDMKALKDHARELAGRIAPSAVMLFGSCGGKVGLVAWVSKDLQGRASAKDWVAGCAGEFGARGGGSAELAQAGGGEPERLDRAMAAARESMRALLAERVA